MSPSHPQSRALTQQLQELSEFLSYMLHRIKVSAKETNEQKKGWDGANNDQEMVN